MSKDAFVRVYRPVDAGDIARVRAILEGRGYRFYIENENYFHASGGVYSFGDTEVWVMVGERHADAVKELLRD